MFDKKPAIIARCNGTADTIHAVNFARENGLLTAVRWAATTQRAAVRATAAS